MIDTSYILTYGQQLLLDPSAWPASPLGTNHRIEPIVPYIEAYWYELSNTAPASATTVDTNLLSIVGSIYPPVTAALLVFVIFAILYHEYNEYIALIAAGLTATMPTLITTFMSGEQLVEPWGIFALFFFIMAYMLAVRNPKSKRLAILAGIAFASNFLGAHYYTVTTGVLVLYILFQGTIDVIRGTSDIDFYKMNVLVIAIITFTFAIFIPYTATLQNRIPAVLGIPIIVAGPLLALILVAFMDYGLRELHKRKIIFKELNLSARLIWIGVITIIAILAIIFTPLGQPIYKYLTLSKNFTTPSSPLFMTVQEFIPTGPFYDFGGQGFGSIASLIFGVPILLWAVISLTLILVALSIYFRSSRTSILYMAIALPLTFAGTSEVKYLPHFGVAYIIMFCIMLGELVYLAERGFKLGFSTKKESTAEQGGQLLDVPKAKNRHYITMILAVGIFFLSSILGVIYLVYVALTEKFTEPNAKTYIYALAIFLILVIIGITIASKSLFFGESSSYMVVFGSALTAASSSNSTSLCNTLQAQGNSLGYTLFCNTIQPYWLNAMAWIKQNVGPNAPRVLSWWDYGDWINWFGNSNAFLRGDNANAIEDYATAAHFVLGDRYSPQSLASFMNGNQSKYVLMDQDLISKWQALDFLACIYTNQTSYDYAVAAGASQNPAQPYALGTSQCEISHDPQFALVPLAALTGNTSQSINYYCSFSNSTVQFAQTFLVTGGSLDNSSVCTSLIPNAKGVLDVYNQSGKRINAYLQSSQYLGVVSVSGAPFVEFMMIYVPNGPNGTITNAPSGFYTSNYYKGFVLGDLPGFTQVYPVNSPGINYLNVTDPVRIYAVNNFTGSLPEVPPKPSWVQNNYTMP
jgi:hypothetical protein